MQKRNGIRARFEIGVHHALAPERPSHQVAGLRVVGWQGIACYHDKLGGLERGFSGLPDLWCRRRGGI